MGARDPSSFSAPRPLDPEEAALAERAARGDPAASRRLLGRHAPALLAFCQAVLGEPAAARACAEDALVRAWGELERYDPERPLAAWLFRFAQEALIERLGPAKAWSPSPQDEPDRACPPLEPGQAGALPAALARLPGKYRAVLHCTYTLGLPPAETADRLGLTPGGVRVCLQGAVRRLRALVAP